MHYHQCPAFVALPKAATRSLQAALWLLHFPLIARLEISFVLRHFRSRHLLYLLPPRFQLLQNLQRDNDETSVRQLFPRMKTVTIITTTTTPTSLVSRMRQGSAARSERSILEVLG